MAETKESVFSRLSAINVNEHVEKKNGLTYLSWAWAWYYIKREYPHAQYTIYETPEGRPYFDDGKTAWVKTGVSIVTGDIDLTFRCYEHIEYLPVMDYNNKSIPLEKITSVDVNKTIQRSLTKACARHGLGLYIYAGEDLPEAMEEKPVPAPKAPKKAAAKKEVSRETWISLIARNVINGDGISAYDAYIAKFRPTPGELADLEGEVEQFKKENNLR